MSSLKKHSAAATPVQGTQFANALALAALSGVVGFLPTAAKAHSSSSQHKHPLKPQSHSAVGYNAHSGKLCHEHSHTHVNPHSGQKTTHNHSHCHAAASNRQVHIHHAVQPASIAKPKLSKAMQQVQRSALQNQQSNPQQNLAPITFIEPPPALQYQALQSPEPSALVVETLSSPKRDTETAAITIESMTTETIKKSRANSDWVNHNRSVDVALALANSTSLGSSNSQAQQLNRTVVSSDTNQAVGVNLGLRFQNTLAEDNKGVYLSADVDHTEARHRIVENNTNIELYNQARGYKSTKSDVKLGYVAKSDEESQVVPYLQLQDNRQSTTYSNQKKSNNQALVGLLLQTKLSDSMRLEGNAAYGRVVRANASQDAVGTESAYDVDLGAGDAIDVGLRMSYELTPKANVFAEAKHSQARLKEISNSPVTGGTQKESRMRMGVSWNY